MGLPFSIPPYIQNGEEAIKQALEIECYHMQSECLGAAVVDERFWLEGNEASSSFFLIPTDVSDPPSYWDAAFYADCLAFEHESSVIAFPRGELIGDDDIPWNIYLRPPDHTPGYHYLELLREGAEAANRLSVGDDYKIIFKYDLLDLAEGEIARISWREAWECVSTAIHLYNAALRQIDPLTQFLCFYRVIESVTQDNGKAWIESELNGMCEYASPIWCDRDAPSFENLVSPEIEVHLRRDRLFGKEQRFNIIEIARAKALRRLEYLQKEPFNNKIAERLYNENRCGIAHGKEIRRHDLSKDFLDVLRDLPLMRYLSRLAIESRLQLN